MLSDDPEFNEITLSLAEQARLLCESAQEVPHPFAAALAVLLTNYGAAITAPTPAKYDRLLVFLRRCLETDLAEYETQQDAVLSVWKDALRSIIPDDWENDPLEGG